MAVGAFNPKGPNSVASRPARNNTDVGVRWWYQDCSTPAAKDGTGLSAQDFNFMLAQYRVAMDYYSVTDLEGDDEILKKLLMAVENQFSGELVRGRHVDSYSGSIGTGTSGAELVSVASIPTATGYERKIQGNASGRVYSGTTWGEEIQLRLQGNSGAGWVDLKHQNSGFGNFAGPSSEMDIDEVTVLWFDTGDTYHSYRLFGIATGDTSWTVQEAFLMVEEVG